MKNGCNKYDENFLAQYIENTLSDEALMEFERHLQTCRACGRKVLMAQKGIFLMKQSNPLEVPAYLLSYIYKKDKNFGLGKILFKWIGNQLELVTQALKGVNLTTETVPVRSNEQSAQRYFIQHYAFTMKLAPKTEKSIDLEIHFKEKNKNEHLQIWNHFSGQSKLVLAITADQNYFSKGSLLPGNYEIRFKEQSIFLNVAE